MIQKTTIQQTKLLLQVGVQLETQHGHSCSSCTKVLNDEESNVYDQLCNVEKVIEIEDSLKDDCKQHLVYIAGYIQFKVDREASGSYVYYEKYGSYLKTLSRGGLTKPIDCMVQWVFVCYALFLSLNCPEAFCRNSLSYYFKDISDVHSLKIKSSASRVLSNMLFNNLCKDVTPLSTKEVRQKQAKLSD